MAAMNRPRNRQPRPPRNNNERSAPPNHRPPQRSQITSTAPTVAQVVPGAGVSIVLKEDQPTGREVQGVVQDLLTRGNHPRGIKVRLQDGRVGRVQRMTGSATNGRGSVPPAQVRQSGRFAAPTDVRNDPYQSEEPPPRSLADFFPDEPASSDPQAVAAATAICPICGLFEGDEIAVSRHVEEHLT